MTPSFPILYEDNHLLVVEKPVNVPVQADVTGDDDLLSMCRRYIKEAYNKPGEAFVALVHRLDRPVGGVMVFARTSKAAARLTAQFKGHTAKKRYAAVVEGCPPAGKRLVDYLLKDERTHSSAVVPEGTEGAKRAELRYQKLAECGGRALLDIELFTGRPHQIRVQLAHDGYPILGDQRYNPAAKPGTQICLWAYALTIQHPTLGEEMTFFSLPGAASPAGEGCAD
ncbi:MAG: RluA family pseudouridine synthase, partial [Candidatus Aphodomorpha sp.]